MNRESPFLKVDKALIHLVSCLIATENNGDIEGAEVNVCIRIHPPPVILQDPPPAAPAPRITYEEAVVRACQDGTMTEKNQKQAIYILDTLNLHPVSVNAENDGENEYLLASEKTTKSLKKREAFKDIINVQPISRASTEGQKLVLGTNVSNLLVTSSTRLDLRNSTSVGAVCQHFAISKEQSRDIRIFLNAKSVEDANTLLQSQHMTNYIEPAHIAYQFRQIRSKFHCKSTYKCYRTSGYITYQCSLQQIHGIMNFSTTVPATKNLIAPA